MRHGFENPQVARDAGRDGFGVNGSRIIQEHFALTDLN